MMRLKGNFKCAYRPSHTQHHALSINTCAVWTTSITMSVCLQVPVWLLTCKCTKQAGIESGGGGCSGMDMLVSPCLSSCLSLFMYVFMSILLNLYKLLTTIISFLYPMHNKVVCVGILVSLRLSIRLSVCASHLPCLLYGLLPTFISATNQCMHHRCLLYLWGEMKS